MGRKNKNIDKESISESWCFVCKDGGLLRICDYKGCLKAFHPQCVDKDDSFLESKVPWSCRWHSCFICKNTPKFHCFCCPKAVCGRCLCDSNFILVKGKRGFCSHCLTLAGLLEGIKSPDSTSGNIDFNDQETYEFNFKAYWKMIKEKEGLTLEHVSYADKLLSMDKNYGYLSDACDIFEWEEYVSEFDENQIISDNDSWNDRKRHKGMGKWKRNKKNESVMEGKTKSKKKEFSGWGSVLLFDFLASIGKDTTNELSQREVTDIIIGYCNEHKLYDPERKKKVVCDARLKSLLGRKSVIKNSIYNCLTPHFAENFEQTEDETGCSSEDKRKNVSMTNTRQKNSSSSVKSQKKEPIPDMQQGCFAAINAENIKRLYLKRSLVQELEKQSEIFDAKVIGSFVRTKSDPYDYLQKNPYQLLKVTGINRSSRNGEVNTDIFLQVCNMPIDIPICKLSDDNFSEEECEDLRQRVKDGRLERPTVVKFKEKARNLHEVITKHWIVKELALLQNLVDQANEKGWRKELSVYMERLMLLRTPSEQSRLLLEVPEIIADEPEVEPADKDLSRKDEQKKITMAESDLRRFSRPSSESPEGNGIYCPNDTADFAEPMQQSKGPELEEPVQPYDSTSNASDDDGSHQAESHESAVEVKKNHSEAPYAELHSGQLLASSSQNQSNFLDLVKQHTSGTATSGGKQDKPMDVEHEKVKNNQSATSMEIIELSDDEEQGKSTPPIKQTPDNLDSPIWYCVSPLGDKLGPCPMSVLKEWSDTCRRDMKFKVWKTGQDPEEAVFLTDAISQVFFGK
ncbi:uncharacterized protein At5g08430 isoform X1 [Ricinus communis]|uniref:uncharacterized protein At5g08430 isoform X1 n=1 Tax=Ricinus communis TaxID=3988 RepID=UPI00201B307E|nr:uncharacterized protein At5g08430 isoform X1 [Ricinus communis]XP_015580667.2 uncharacterized protein At5g08430 isoform X1 [Ricinus communis]XP_048231773.1 uncharacterized protein At5g08430 isoform X1 [Ricinus communis]